MSCTPAHFLIIPHMEMLGRITKHSKHAAVITMTHKRAFSSPLDRKSPQTNSIINCERTQPPNGTYAPPSFLKITHAHTTGRTIEGSEVLLAEAITQGTWAETSSRNPRPPLPHGHNHTTLFPHEPRGERAHLLTKITKPTSIALLGRGPPTASTKHTRP